MAAGKTALNLKPEYLFFYYDTKIVKKAALIIKSAVYHFSVSNPV